MPRVIELGSTSPGCGKWTVQCQIGAMGRAAGSLWHDGKYVKDFDVFIGETRRFRVTIGVYDYDVTAKRRSVGFHCDTNARELSR